MTYYAPDPDDYRPGDETGPQPRERACPCSRCRQPTWNVSAVCDDCAFRETQTSAGIRAGAA